MASKGQIVIGMAVDHSQFSSGLKWGKSALDSFGSSLAATKGNVVAFGAVIGAIGAHAFTQLITGSMDAINSQGDLALQLGVSTTALQQLSYVAEATGSDSQTLTASMEKLQMSIGEAASGSGAAADAFNALGVDLQTLQSQSPDEQFRTLVGAIDAVSDSSQQAALVADIFGKANIGLVNTINEGVGALDANREAALAMGVALSDVDNTAIADAQGALDAAGLAIGGVVNKLTASLAPAIEEGATLFTAFVSEAMKSQFVAEIFLTAGDALRLAVGVAKQFFSALQGVAAFAANPGKALANLATTGQLVDAKIKNIESNSEKAATAVGKIGKSLDEKVFTAVEASLKHIFDDLDKRIKGFGKTQFQIEQAEIKETRGNERKKLKDNGASDQQLLKHDQQTARLLSEHREKSRTVAINEETEQQKEKARQAVTETPEQKAEKEKQDQLSILTETNKDSDERDLQAANAIREQNLTAQEKYEAELAELKRLNVTTFDGGVQALSDDDFKKAKARLEKQYRQDLAAEKQNMPNVDPFIQRQKDKGIDVVKADKPDFRGNTLIEAGTVAARETILANRYGSGPDWGKQQVDLNKQQLAEARKTNKALSSKPISFVQVSLS